MKKRLGLAEFTSKIIGKPYSLGCTDCFSIVRDLCEKGGVEIPSEFDGVSQENYSELYKNDPGRVMQAFIELISTLGAEVQPAFAFAGDLLVMKLKKTANAKTFVVIHAGQDKFISAFTDRGICTADLKFYEILKAYRWRK